MLERFRMEKFSSSPISIQIGYKFSLNQCPKNKLKCKQMNDIPYSSIVESVMYAQTCTRPEISFVVGMLGHYQRKIVKKVLR